MAETPTTRQRGRTRTPSKKEPKQKPTWGAVISGVLLYANEVLHFDANQKVSVGTAAAARRRRRWHDRHVGPSLHFEPPKALQRFEQRPEDEAHQAGANHRHALFFSQP